MAFIYNDTDGKNLKKIDVGGTYQPSTLVLDSTKLNKDYSNTQPAVDDIEFSQNTLGVILIDRTTGTKYRLYVDNGTLGIESV